MSPRKLHLGRRVLCLLVAGVVLLGYAGWRSASLESNRHAIRAALLAVPCATSSNSAGSVGLNPDYIGRALSGPWYSTKISQEVHLAIPPFCLDSVSQAIQVNNGVVVVVP